VFLLRCPSHPVRIWFRTPGTCRTHGHQTYDLHRIRRYRPTRDRLNFRLKIRLSTPNSPSRTERDRVLIAIAAA
jgi:hypothetical protein